MKTFLGVSIARLEQFILSETKEIVLLLFCIMEIQIKLFYLEHIFRININLKCVQSKIICPLVMAACAYVYLVTAHQDRLC